MLSDYKRIIEKPMIESYEATIAAQRTEIERLRAAIGQVKLLAAECLAVDEETTHDFRIGCIERVADAALQPEK